MNHQTTSAALSDAEHDVRLLARGVTERTLVIQEECQRLTVLLRNLRSWTSQQYAQQNNPNSALAGHFLEQAAVHPPPPPPPAPSSPISAVLLKMDSGLDKILSKARRVRTTGTNQAAIKSETKPTPKSSSSNTASSASTASATTAARPPITGTTRTTAAAVRLTLPKSENSKRARFLQQLHGRMDMSNVAKARSSFLVAMSDAASRSGEVNEAVDAAVDEAVDEEEDEEEGARTIRLQSSQHLSMFLSAMSVARQQKVPDRVQHRTHHHRPGITATTLSGSPLDDYVASVAAHPTSEKQAFIELRQVGYGKTEMDHLYFEKLLQEIAMERLVPVLRTFHTSVVAGSQAGSQAGGQDEQLRAMLLLYRLTESMLKRKGIQMIRVGMVTEENK